MTDKNKTLGTVISEVITWAIYESLNKGEISLDDIRPKHNQAIADIKGLLPKKKKGCMGITCDCQEYNKVITEIHERLGL